MYERIVLKYSLVVYFNVKIHDMWEGNVTIRCQISTENICSLGFRDVREGVALRRFILWSLECICFEVWVAQAKPWQKKSNLTIFNCSSCVPKFFYPFLTTIESIIGHLMLHDKSQWPLVEMPIRFWGHTRSIVHYNSQGLYKVSLYLRKKPPWWVGRWLLLIEPYVRGGCCDCKIQTSEIQVLDP